MINWDKPLRIQGGSCSGVKTVEVMRFSHPIADKMAFPYRVLFEDGQSGFFRVGGVGYIQAGAFQISVGLENYEPEHYVNVFSGKNDIATSATVYKDAETARQDSKGIRGYQCTARLQVV